MTSSVEKAAMKNTGVPRIILSSSSLCESESAADEKPPSTNSAAKSTPFNSSKSAAAFSTFEMTGSGETDRVSSGKQRHIASRRPSSCQPGNLDYLDLSQLGLGNDESNVKVLFPSFFSSFASYFFEKMLTFYKSLLFCQ